MTGESERETASKGLFSSIKGFDPTVENRFTKPDVLPHKPSTFLSTFRGATKAGVKDLSRQTDKNIKTAQKSTTAGAQSRGLGGSVLEDAIAKSRAKASGQGTNAIQRFLTSRKGQETGVKESANKQGLALAGAQTGVDFKNIMAMFQKFNSLGGAIGGLDDDTFLDDLFAGLNTASNFVPLFG